MIRYVTLALALIAAPAIAPAPAEASDLNWDWDMGSGSATAKHRAAARYAYRQRHRRASSSSGPKVMAYSKREEPPKKVEDDGFQCVDQVRGLGTQWIGTEGAMEAAKKDWMERVRYDHGESYVDMSNAREFESRCGRVSIGEIAGQVTYRCEVMARPCKPPLKEVKIEPKGSK